jgi:hypothetical protein
MIGCFTNGKDTLFQRHNKATAAKVINIFLFSVILQKNTSKKTVNYSLLTKKTLLLRHHLQCEHETELETWHHDIPAARAAGQLWGVARRV